MSAEFKQRIIDSFDDKNPPAEGYKVDNVTNLRPILAIFLGMCSDDTELYA